jgi:hypothetical protein
MRQIRTRGASTAASAADTSRGTSAAVGSALMTDPTDSPFRTRQQAEAVFAHFRSGAEHGPYRPTSQFLADALADSIHVFDVRLGGYDRELIARLARLLDPVDVALICSWIRRAAHDCPDQAVYISDRNTSNPFPQNRRNIAHDNY